MDDCLAHHGVKGQKWGVRRYQNKDGSLTSEGKRHRGVVDVKKSSKNSTEAFLKNKKQNDFVLKKDTKLQTLSSSPDRLKNTDMFYASHTEHDNAFYKSMFSVNLGQVLYERKKPSTKYSINSKVLKNMTVASEKSGADAFTKLLKSDPEVRDFVLNPSKMESYYTTRASRQFSGYREALRTLDKMRKNSSKISKKDAAVVYRLFNYTIPNESSVAVRNKFFDALKKEGYGGVLDTNDGIYGGFKTHSPVIIFDMDNIFSESVTDVKVSEIPSSFVTSYATRKEYGGIYGR